MHPFKLRLAHQLSHIVSCIDIRSGMNRVLHASRLASLSVSCRHPLAEASASASPSHIDLTTHNSAGSEAPVVKKQRTLVPARLNFPVYRQSDGARIDITPKCATLFPCPYASLGKCGKTVHNLGGCQTKQALGRHVRWHVDQGHEMPEAVCTRRKRPSCSDPPQPVGKQQKLGFIKAAYSILTVQFPSAVGLGPTGSTNTHMEAAQARVL